ncbi:MAG: MogA/MoaB family molybdenum cofactor biosynthesis protein [Candidatus Aureabacteria bacterium]|nr:MogA/MoaB family molybdenum cofactor biosynthesis protein [Candidatus Auribacterota bacterium]
MRSRREGGGNASAIRVGVVVVSDKAAAGLRRDGCVGALEKVLPPADAAIAAHTIVPDEIGAIQEAVQQMTDGEGLDVVLTAGGTGIGPRDVTPEAILPLIDRAIPGIAELMRRQGFEMTPNAILSRSVAGTRGRALLIALPGSPRGAAECLSSVWPAIPHALALLRGEATECARKVKSQKQKGKTKS